MIALTLTGTRNPALEARDTVLCPCLEGLTGRQADLALLMPRRDNNGALLAASGHIGAHAGVLTCDPFRHQGRFLTALREHGYAGVANWPSSILLEGRLLIEMRSIPVTPELEYDWLARAQEEGLATLAFVRTPEQARSALRAGLRRLVLHPGSDIHARMKLETDPLAALVRDAAALKSEAPDCTLLLYDRSDLPPEDAIRVGSFDGSVTYGGAP